MSNKSRGIQKERDAKNQLKDKGFTCIRARGSLGVVDVIAFNEEEVKLISVKRVKGKYFSFKQEKEFLQTLKIPPCAKVELWIWLDRIAGVRKAHWQKEIIKEEEK